MARSWQDALDFKVYISTAGDFVSLGTRSEYPFYAGGSGYPSGWTMYNTAGTSPSDVNWTTQNGRFSISNALLSDPGGNSGKFYGVYRDFPVTPGHYYIIQLQARNMDDKTQTQRNIRYEWSNGAGSGAYGNAYQDWEQVSIPTGQAPAGVTFLRVIVQAVYYWGVSNNLAPTPDPNWGAQFQNVAIIDQLATYPEPTWDEVTCEVQNLSLRYGRDKFVSRYDVAQMSIGLVNNSGDFTYNPLTTLRPGRFIKLEVNETGKSTVYDQFYGLIDSLTDSFTLDGRAMTVIQAVDVSSLLSNTEVPTATWTKQTYWSGPRFARLLDAVAWHPSMRANDPGNYVQQAILANGRSVRDELGLIADSEGGWFYCDRSGIVTFKDRDWSSPTNTRVTAELLAQEPLPPMLVPGVKFVFNAPPNGDFMTTPHEPALSITGDLEVFVRLSFSDLTTAIDQNIICKSRSATGAEWAIGKNANTGLMNRPYVIYANVQATATAEIPFAVNQTFWLRVLRRQGTGNTAFYTAADKDEIPTSWTQLGNTVASTPNLTPVVGTSPIDIGMRQLFGTAASTFRGTLRRAIVHQGVAGPTIFDVQTADAVSAGPGALAFNSTSGHPITVNQATGHTVVQDDTRYSYDLPVVDSIPNLPGLPIICVRELQTTWSRDRVVNEVSLANQGGSAFTTVDQASQQKYGPRTYQRMDFLNDNAHPEYLIERTADIMTGYTDAIVRINSVSFNPTLTPAAYAWALSIWLNDLVRLRYTHPTEGWGFSVVSHVQGIEHGLSQNDWGMTLLLDEPEAFNFWNEATGAGWDISEWDVDLWDADRADRVYWSSGQRWSEGHRWG